MLVNERGYRREFMVVDARLHLFPKDGPGGALCGAKGGVAASYETRNADLKQCEKCWGLLLEIRKRESTR
jgi:hypothetical protein